MTKHLCTTSCILCLLLLFPAGASATTGLPGPGFAVMVLAFYVTPVAAFLLIVAFIQRWNQGKYHPKALICAALVTLFTGCLGFAYLNGILNHWYTANEALTLAFVFTVFLITLLFYFIDNGRRRFALILFTVVAITLVNILTPAIVSFRYYTFVENNLDDDPSTIENEVIEGVGKQYAKLSDGRLLAFNDHINLAGKSRKVIVNPIGDDRYQVSFRGKTAFPNASNLKRYKLESQAFFRVPLREVVVNTNRVFSMGTAELVDEQEAKNVLLYHASGQYHCKPEQARLLLETGANPNYTMHTTGYPPTPLFHALKSRCLEVAAVLIAAGADMQAVNESSSFQNTALHDAVVFASLQESDDELKLIAQLIEAGADVSATDSIGQTALHLATPRRFKIASMLIRAGADVSAKTITGDTPLHYAVRGPACFAELLVGAGANINAINADGETPLDKARRYLQTGQGNREELELIIEILESGQTEAV